MGDRRPACHAVNLAQRGNVIELIGIHTTGVQSPSKKSSEEKLVDRVLKDRNIKTLDILTRGCES